MARFVALLVSYRESAGCDVHHASAGGDRLIVLTTLGVAYEDGASVLVGYDKTFSKWHAMVQGMQKRGPEECIGNYIPQVARGCGYWFWHYFGSRRQA